MSVKRQPHQLSGLNNDEGSLGAMSRQQQSHISPGRNIGAGAYPPKAQGMTKYAKILRQSIDYMGGRRDRSSF